MSLFKKVAVAAAAVVLAASLTSAQEWASSEGSCYQKGDKIAQVGLLFPGLGLLGSAEYGFHPAVSGGVNVGYYTWSYEWWAVHYFNVTGYAAVHLQNVIVLKEFFPMPDKLDVYVGLGLGFRNDWETVDGTGIIPTYTSSNPFLFREHVGARYYFAPNMSVFFEENGYEPCLGVAIKF